MQPLSRRRSAFDLPGSKQLETGIPKGACPDAEGLESTAEEQTHLLPPSPR